MTRPRAACGPATRCQLLHQKRIRQSVKPIPAHALRLIAARDRQHLRHARQVVVKGRIETRHLHQIGKPAMKCLGQQDLFRQMFGIERLKLV